MKSYLYLFLLFLFAIGSSSAWATTECSQVEFYNKKIVCFTKGVNKLTASERAHILEKRLIEISNNSSLDPKQISIHEDGNVLSVELNDYFIFSLRPDDFIYPEGEDYKVSAQKIISSIQQTMLNDRDSRAPEVLIKGAINSAIATLILVLFLFFLSSIYPRLYSMLNQERSIPSVKIQNWEVIKSEHITGIIIWLAKALRTILTLITLYIYISMVLSFFPQTAKLAPQLLSFIVNPFKLLSQAVINFIPNLFFILTIFVITHYVLKLVRFFFDEIDRGNIQFEGFYKEWARPSYMLFRVLAFAFAAVMAFPYIPGSDSPAFRGVSVFLGILFSLGSTSAISNIIAGVVLTYMRPFNVGDIVKIADTEGCVTEKNLLVTRVRTVKNIDITVPNSLVLGSHMVNYSSTVDGQGLILKTPVTFGYDVPWTKIHELLKIAASRTSFIEKDPHPFILQTALDEFYVHYELNVYTKHPAMMASITSELHQNIQDIFHENEIELLVPHYTSIRDGNETTLPKRYRNAGYKIPGFKIETII